MAWEYLVVRLSAHYIVEVERGLQSDLNSYGEDGWELIALEAMGAADSAMAHRAVFKRLLVAPAADSEPADAADAAGAADPTS